MASNVFGRVVLELAASVGTLQTDLNKSVKVAQDFKGRMTGIADSVGSAFAAIGATAAVGAFAVSLKSIIDQADEFSKLSQKVGVGVEALQELNYAASLSDVSTESLGTALRKLAQKTSEAAGGNKEAIATFEKLNISIRDNNGVVKTNEQLFKELADRFAGYQDGINKTAQATEIFGKSGAELIPLLNSSSAGLAEMAEEARTLGIVLSQEDAKAAEQFNDNLTRLGASVDGVKVKIVSGFLPSLVAVTDAFVSAAKEGDGLKDVGEGIGEIFKALSVFGIEVAYVLDQTGKEIGGVAAQLRVLTEDVSALQLLAPITIPFSLNYEGAAKVREEMIKDAEAARKAVDRRTSLILNPPKQASYSNEGRQFLQGSGVPSLPDAPPTGTPSRSGSGANKAAQARKAALDAELKNLDRFISDEKETLSLRKTFLDAYYQDEQLSFSDYFAGLSNARQENLSNTLSAIDKEIAALEAYKSKSDPAARVQAEEKIRDLIAKRADAESKAAVDTITGLREQEKELDKYTRELAELDAKLAEMEGNRSVSVSIKFDLENEELANRLLIQGDLPGLEKLNKVKLLTISNADIEDLNSQIDSILKSLSNKEGSIELGLKLGTETELSSLDKLSSARSDAVVQLDGIADAWQRIVDKTGDPKLQQQLDAFRLSVGNLAADSDLLADKFNSIFSDAFASFADDLIEVSKGTKSLSDAFEDMASSILQSINRIAAQNIAESIFGGGGGGGGGLLGNIFSGLFGGGAGVGGAVDPIVPLLFADGGVFQSGRVKKFANGGSFSNGIVSSPTLFNIGEMGEAGEEALVPLVRDRNNRLAVSTVGKGGGNVQPINFYITTPDANSFRKSQSQIMADANRSLRQGRRNE